MSDTAKPVESPPLVLARLLRIAGFATMLLAMAFPIVQIESCGVPIPVSPPHQGPYLLTGVDLLMGRIRPIVILRMESTACRLQTCPWSGRDHFHPDPTRTHRVEATPNSIAGAVVLSWFAVVLMVLGMLASASRLVRGSSRMGARGFLFFITAVFTVGVLAGAVSNASPADSDHFISEPAQPGFGLFLIGAGIVAGVGLVEMAVAVVRRLASVF